MPVCLEAFAEGFGGGGAVEGEELGWGRKRECSGGRGGRGVTGKRVKSTFSVHQSRVSSPMAPMNSLKPASPCSGLDEEVSR